VNILASAALQSELRDVSWSGAFLIVFSRTDLRADANCLRILRRLDARHFGVLPGVWPSGAFRLRPGPETLHVKTGSRGGLVAGLVLTVIAYAVLLLFAATYWHWLGYV